MVTIHQMTSADIEVVCQLDLLAFMAYVRQNGYTGAMYPRTRENLLACLHLNPEGCYIGKTDKLVGYIFTHILGTTGWIGTFGVHPDFQGKSLGRSLLDTAVEYLQEAGCITIGLETMSDSPYNVGFYSHCGFIPVYPTVLLIKETGLPTRIIAPYTVLSQVEDEIGLSAVREISQGACPGLDYVSEVSNAHEYGWGETLFVGWPQPWAFALVRTTTKREGMVESLADVIALLIDSKARGSLDDVLQVIEDFAYRRGLEQVNLAVNTVDGESLQQVLKYGFRVQKVMIRMVFNKGATPLVGKVLSKWLM